MGEGETFTFLSGEGQRAGNAEHVEECIYFFVVPRFALHFGLQQRGIGFVLLPTQGSQPQFTLGYSHAVPPNARPSDLEERRSGGPDGMLLLVIGLSCAPETGSIPRDRVGPHFSRYGFGLDPVEGCGAQMLDPNKGNK
jgi:hypothetical protein